MDVSTFKTVQVKAAAHGQSNDPFGVVLDLSNLPAYRIDELKFWLKCRGDSLKDFPRRPRVFKGENHKYSQPSRVTDIIILSEFNFRCV